MKRVYAAAALMVAVGAAIGYMLAPQAPAVEEQVVAEQQTERAPTQTHEKARKRSSGGGGGGFFIGGGGSQNKIEKMVAAKASTGGGRPDCYFIGVSYRSALQNGGAKSPKAIEAANNAKRAGCEGAGW